MEQGHFLLYQRLFLRRHRDTQHDLPLPVRHASPPFCIRVWDYPNKRKRTRPGRGGAGRFPGVWLHSLCLLRYPSPRTASPVLRTNKANWNAQTVRQRLEISEKAQKNRSRSAFSQSDLYLLSIAPSNAPSMTGRCSSGHISTLRLMRWRWSFSSPATSWLKYFAAGRLRI